MQSERIRIEIGGAEATDVYGSVLGLEVALDDELAALFTLRLALTQQPDGSWSGVDDERLVVWQPVVISAGFGDGALEELIDGVITHVRPDFDPDPTSCTLEIWGMDRSVLLDQQEICKDWPNRRDSDIAREIFSSHGLDTDVQDTDVSHDEPLSTIIQRETDMAFLGRLAARNGYECFVEGGTGHFRTPQLDAPPQPVLAAHFGDDTTLHRFGVRVNALAPARVSLAQLARASKDILRVAIDATTQPGFGKVDTSALRPPALPPAQVLGQAVTTGEPELTALGQSAYDQGEWFVQADGEIDAGAYGHVLRPRRTVTVKGVGETHSGVYRVTHVTHSFGPDGYLQRFRARRNGLRPTGSERFTDAAGLLGGLL